MATEFADKPRKGFALAQIMSESPEVADAFDALFGALRLAPPLASGNVILVTSAEPGEGKTTVASCLATTASLAGQTVLLIDGDLRRSSFTATVGSGDTSHKRTRLHPKFPANREKYREFCDLGASSADSIARSRCAAATFKQIPCAN